MAKRAPPSSQPTLLERAAERGELGGTQKPLADRLRPRTLEEVVGQIHLLGQGKLLGEAIRKDRVPSLILWGPPGSGKTTLAHVIAHVTRTEFVAFSAVLGGLPELRIQIEAARERRRYHGRGTTLFVDEIHRFNKSQQDAFLPHIEDGTITVVGATTENPSFAVNAALLSRCRVFRLDRLAPPELVKLLERALADEARGLGELALVAEPDALAAIADSARGDARRALGLLEVAAGLVGENGHIDLEVVKRAAEERTLLYDKSGEEHYNVASALADEARGLGELALVALPDALAAIADSARGDARRALGLLEVAAGLVGENGRIDLDVIKRAAEERTLLYDKSGEEHYNVVSALIKSMRGSDPDAAIYWLLRMLDAGDDPLFLSRRLVIFASEDVGNADPRALAVAVQADEALRRIGLPEGVYPLAHACLYLASCPKSNAVKRAIEATRQVIAEHGALPVPLKLRNAVTSLMRNEGYGKDYRYAHDYENSHVPGETYLPDALSGRRFYEPSAEGLEQSIRERLERLRRGG